MNRTFLLLPMLLMLLSACASQQPLQTSGQEAPEVVPEEAQELPERAIPQDSVYPLLLAEFALRRRQYDVALTQYMRLAPALRDPGVSAHATHLAQFLQREPEAQQAVRLWVELEPDSAEANNTLAILLVRRGRNLEAAPHLETVARSGAQANFPILLNGFKQMNPDGRSRLVSAINDLAAAFPSDPQMLLTQALLHEELGQSAQAIAKLEQLLEQEPYQQQALLLEANLLQQTGAKAPYARIDAALQAQPENRQLRLQYARLLTRSDIQAARAQFETLAAQNPNDGDLLLSLALINREIGDQQTAEGYLRQLLVLGEHEDDAHFYLGLMAEEAEDNETAIAEYMRVEDGREFYSASARVGRILLAAGQSDKLHDHYAVLRERYPDRSERLYALEADLHSRAGNVEKAIAILTQALQELPNSSSLRYTRSMLGEQHNDLHLMESDLRALIAQDSNNATALNALGYTLANRTGRYDEAFELISRALQLQPNEPAILDSMGWILYRQGQYEEALRYLRKAYARFPDPEVAAHLGEVLWVSGDTTGAKKIWRGALEKDPEHEILLSTIRRLGVTELDSNY